MQLRFSISRRIENNLLLPTYLNLIDRASSFKPLSEFVITAAYATTHRDRHDRLISANSAYYLAGYAAFIRDMPDGLSTNPYTHLLFEKYDYHSDAEKTNE